MLLNTNCWSQSIGKEKKKIHQVIQGQENDHLSVLLCGYNNTTDHSKVIISSYDVDVL